MIESNKQEHARLTNILHEHEHNRDYYGIDLPNSISLVKEKLIELENQTENYFENGITEG